MHSKLQEHRDKLARTAVFYHADNSMTRMLIDMLDALIGLDRMHGPPTATWWVAK